jgi:hypothetical protein
MTPSPTTPMPPPRSSPPSSSSGSLWDSDIVQREFDVLMRDFKDVRVLRVGKECEESARVCARTHRKESWDSRAGARATPRPALSHNPSTPAFSLSVSLSQLMGLQPKFPDFDPDGKAIYLDRLDDLGDRLAIFLARMRLADDGVAKAWLRDLNAQLAGAGLSVDTLQAGLKASTDEMRAWVAREAAAGSDPAAAAAAKAALRARFAGAPDVGALLSDPAIAPALADPRVLAAVKAGVEGGPAAVGEFLDDPVIGPVLKKLFAQLGK